MNENKFNMKYLVVVPLIVLAIFSTVVGLKKLKEVENIKSGEVDNPEILKLHWRMWDQTADALSIRDYVDYRNTDVEDNNKLTYISKKGSINAPGNGDSKQVIKADKNIIWRVWSNDNDDYTEIIAQSPVDSVNIKGPLGYLWWEHTANAVASLYGHGKYSLKDKDKTYTVGSNLDSENDTKVISKENEVLKDGNIKDSSSRALSLKDIEKYIKHVKIDKKKEDLDKYKKEFKNRYENMADSKTNYLTLNPKNSNPNIPGLSKDMKTFGSLGYNSENYSIKRNDYSLDKSIRKKMIHKKDTYDLASRIINVKNGKLNYDNLSVTEYYISNFNENLTADDNSKSNEDDDIYPKDSHKTKILPVVKLSPDNKYTEVPLKFRVDGSRTWAINVPDKTKTITLDNAYNIFAENINVNVYGEDELLYNVKNLDKKSAEIIVKDWKKLYGEDLKLSYEVEGLPYGYTSKVTQKGDEAIVKLIPKKYNAITALKLDGGLDRTETLEGNLILKKKVSGNWVQLDKIKWDRNLLGFKEFNKYPFTDSEGNIIEYKVEANITGGDDKNNYVIEHKNNVYTSGSSIENIDIKFKSPKKSHTFKVNKFKKEDEAYEVKVDLYANSKKLENMSKKVKLGETAKWDNLDEFNMLGHKIKYFAAIDSSQLKDGNYLTNRNTVKIFEKDKNKVNDKDKDKDKDKELKEVVTNKITKNIIIDGGLWLFPNTIKIQAVRLNEKGATEVLENISVTKEEFKKNGGIVFLSTEKEYPISDDYEYDIRIETVPKEKENFKYNSGNYSYESSETSILGNVKYENGEYLRKDIPVLLERINRRTNEKTIVDYKLLSLEDFEKGERDIKFTCDNYGITGNEYKYNIIYPDIDEFEKEEKIMPQPNSAVYTFTPDKTGIYKKKIVKNGGASIAVKADLLVRTVTRIKDKSENRKQIILTDQKEIKWDNLPITTSKGEVYEYEILPEISDRDSARGYYISLDNNSNIVVKFISRKADIATTLEFLGGEDKRKPVKIKLKRTSDAIKFENVAEQIINPDVVSEGAEAIIFDELDIMNNNGMEYTYVFEYPTQVDEFKKEVIPEVEESEDEEAELEIVRYIHKDYTKDSDN